MQQATNCLLLFEKIVLQHKYSNLYLQKTWPFMLGQENI